MQLTPDQVRLIQAGQAVEIEDAEIGDTCFVVLAKAVRKFAPPEDIDLPMDVVAKLINDTMSEYDADDPYLHLYQEQGL